MNRIAKTTYMILCGALMLCSCTQEETPVERQYSNDRRIVFNTSIPELTTRASEITTAQSLTHFRMTAFDETDSRLEAGDTLKGYFYNKKLAVEPGSYKAVSDECIWPEMGHESDKLHFFAYYPELMSGASTVNGTSTRPNRTIGYKINGFRVASDIANQVDFVTAYTTGTMDDNYFSGINLNFRHQLSRIEVKAKGAHKSCDIEIAGVRISQAPVQGNFEFQTSGEDGKWTDISKGNAEYIFRNGDAIVKVMGEPISIMGKKIGGGYDNCAMLIPTQCPAWDYTKDASNNGKGMYLNVLLRIIDKTPTTGNGKVQFPYYDNSQGVNAMNIERVYMAVDLNGIIRDNPGQLYKGDDGKYYTNASHTTAYITPQGCEVREFGWAALPVSADWQPGYSYCYTLDYTSGVGLHGPDVTGDVSPKAGDPIISDRVGVSVSVNGWQGLNGTTTHPIEVPGA